MKQLMYHWPLRGKAAKIKQRREYLEHLFFFFYMKQRCEELTTPPLPRSSCLYTYRAVSDTLGADRLGCAFPFLKVFSLGCPVACLLHWKEERGENDALEEDEVWATTKSIQLQRFCFKFIWIEGEERGKRELKEIDMLHQSWIPQGNEKGKKS